MDPRTYADNLATLALRIIGAVHDDGPKAIREALNAARSLIPPRGTDPDDALIVTLAAMCNADQPRSELLSWTTRLTGGVSDLLPRRDDAVYRTNTLAVEMGLSGVLPAAALNPAELEHVARELTRRGWDIDAIAAHLDTEPTKIRRSLNRPARRQRAA